MAVDTLTVDYTTVPGQLYACVSFVGPEQPQKNELLGMKIRGCFPDKESAAAHAKRLQREDATFDIYVVDMYKWLLIPPKSEAIDDVHYSNNKLEEIMTKYRENSREAAAMFEKRKRDMMAQPGPDPNAPFLDPSDENSRYYTKPDVPPIPHPAEILEKLKEEFPDKPVELLVKMADAEVQLEIERRKNESSEVTVNTVEAQ
jgi:Family of unknown function (DUF5832)